MRRTVKFLHTIASCGLIGALLGYVAILVAAPQDSARSYAEMRQTIGVLCNYLLLPSLAVALISGLFSMLVHKPFLETRWAWAKAVLGLSMFEATLAVIQAKSASAIEASAQVAAGTGEPGALASVIANEWITLAVVLALSGAQVALGVWRPVLARPQPQRQ